MSATSENIRQVHAQVHTLIDTLEGPPEGRPSAATAALKLHGLATALEIVARTEDERPDLEARIARAVETLSSREAAGFKVSQAIQDLTRP